MEHILFSTTDNYSTSTLARLEISTQRHHTTTFACFKATHLSFHGGIVFVRIELARVQYRLAFCPSTTTFSTLCLVGYGTLLRLLRLVEFDGSMFSIDGLLATCLAGAEQVATWEVICCFVFVTNVVLARGILLGWSTGLVAWLGRGEERSSGR